MGIRQLVRVAVPLGALVVAAAPVGGQPPLQPAGPAAFVGADGVPVVVLPDPPAGGPPTLYESEPGVPFMATSTALCDGLRADCPRWFAGASGLVMTRTLPSGAPAAVLPPGGVVLTTAAAAATWPGGVDLRLGRWFGPAGTQAIECVYWGVYGLGSAATVTDAANRLQAVPQAPGVTVAGAPAAEFLASARAEQIARSDLVNDLEINWLFAPWGRPEYVGVDDGVFTLGLLAGFRFFQLEDVLTLTSLAGTAPAGATFGVAGGADQLALALATNNNIYGPQFGGRADWHLTPRLRLSLVEKGLIGGNAITTSAALATGNGIGATFADGQPVRTHAATSTFAYLAQLDAGLVWDVTSTWSLSLGYRLVGVGNIGQSDASWPRTVTGPGSLTHLTTNGSTLVHGGFAGFEGRY